MSFLDLSMVNNGKEYPMWVYEGVNKLMDKVDKQDIWETVDFIIKVWEKRYPAEAKQFGLDQEAYRNSRKNDFASTDDKSKRSLANIPPLIKHLFDKIISHKIEAYGSKKFYHDLVRRYPVFSSARKI